MATKKPDIIALIEAAYRLNVDEPTWIAGVTDAATPLLEEGHGVAGYLIDTTGTRPPAHTPAFRGADPWNGEWRKRWWEARVLRMPMKLIADLAGFGTPTYASRSCGAVMQGAVVERLARNVPPLPLPPGVRDALVISALDPGGSGAVLFAFRDGHATRRPRETSRWQRVCAHLATAVRLRRRRPEGRPVHAAGVDQARLRKNRTQDEALELWPAMRDGAAIVPTARGYVLMDSAVDGAPFETLTIRERAVASLVCLGRSNKAIAYELGVMPSTVSTLLSGAARKLDVPGAAGVIGRARGCVQMLPTAARIARERGLTEAEATVLCLLLAGLPDLEIGAVRNTARSTVTKQVDGVFKKLGVGSRRELHSSFAPWTGGPRNAK